MGMVGNGNQRSTDCARSRARLRQASHSVSGRGLLADSERRPELLDSGGDLRLPLVSRQARTFIRFNNGEEILTTENSRSRRMQVGDLEKDDGSSNR